MIPSSPAHSPSEEPPPGRESAAANGAEKAAAHPVQGFLKVLGPGLITGASDDDPSGIATYASAGAAFGFGTLWTALVTLPLMTAVQFICAKIGLVSGRGLAGVLRDHYPRAVLYPAVLGLVVANTINAGVDIGAIASGVHLLAPGVGELALVVPITLVILALQIWGSYRLITGTFKWLTLSLFAYVGAALLARPDWGEVLEGTFFPRVAMDARFLAMLVAILGTTISPYLFFWQASQEVEEEIALGRRKLRQRTGASDAELRCSPWDVGLGMFFSNAVMFFIILATGAALFRPESPVEIETAAQAAEALQPLAGDAAKVLLALGLIGTGFLAVPVLTASSAYGLAEAFRWKLGLDRKPHRARSFYLVIVLSTVAGMAINFLGLDPIRALVWTAVINGFLAPPLLVLIMLIGNNRAVMGSRVNGPVLNVLGWFTTLAMFAAAAGLVLTWGQG